MINDELPDEILKCYTQARKKKMTQTFSNDNRQLSQVQIKALLPHRDPMLWLSEVIGYDIEKRHISGSLKLENHDVFKGHFPNEPVFPGVLQIECIGQLGTILFMMSASLKGERPFLTQVLDAKFISAVRPPNPLFINAIVFQQAIDYIVVGQCIQKDIIASCAILRGMF